MNKNLNETMELIEQILITESKNNKNCKKVLYNTLIPSEYRPSLFTLKTRKAKEKFSKLIELLLPTSIVLNKYFTEQNIKNYKKMMMYKHRYEHSKANDIKNEIGKVYHIIQNGLCFYLKILKECETFFIKNHEKAKHLIPDIVRYKNKELPMDLYYSLILYLRDEYKMDLSDISKLLDFQRNMLIFSEESVKERLVDPMTIEYIKKLLGLPYISDFDKIYEPTSGITNYFDSYFMVKDVSEVEYMQLMSLYYENISGTKLFNDISILLDFEYEASSYFGSFLYKLCKSNTTITKPLAQLLGDMVSKWDTSDDIYLYGVLDNCALYTKELIEQILYYTRISLIYAIPKIIKKTHEELEDYFIDFPEKDDCPDIVTSNTDIDIFAMIYELFDMDYNTFKNLLKDIEDNDEEILKLYDAIAFLNLELNI